MKKRSMRQHSVNATQKTCPGCGKTCTLYRRKTCSKSCQIKHVTSVNKKHFESVRVFNAFLPADEESNIEGFWVPSPAEIEMGTDKIKRAMELNPGTAEKNKARTTGNTRNRRLQRMRLILSHNENHKDKQQ